MRTILSIGFVGDMAFHVGLIMFGRFTKRPHKRRVRHPSNGCADCERGVLHLHTN